MIPMICGCAMREMGREVIIPMKPKPNRTEQPKHKRINSIVNYRMKMLLMPHNLHLDDDYKIKWLFFSNTLPHRVSAFSFESRVNANGWLLLQSGFHYPLIVLRLKNRFRD